MGKPEGGASNPQPSISEQIAVWDRIVQVQMHFNDISLRIRNFFVSVVLAVFGGAGFILHQKLFLEFGSVKVSPLPLLFALGFVASFLLYFMDRYWYHRLLKGSVDAAIPLAMQIGGDLKGVDLGEKISSASKMSVTKYPWLRFFKRIGILKTTQLLKISETHSEEVISSDGKLEVFYRSIFYLFFLLIVLSLLFGVFINDTLWMMAF